MSEEPEKISWRERIRSGFHGNLLTILSVSFSSFLILGIITVFLLALQSFLNGQGGVISGIAGFLSFLGVAVFSGFLLFQGIRAISIFRGTVRWYWERWTPPHEEGEDLPDIYDYYSISPEPYNENADMKEIKRATLLHFLIGLIFWFGGVRFSIWSINNPSVVGSAFQGDSIVSILVQMILYLYEFPVFILNHLNLSIGGSPIDSVIQISLVFLPSLWFSISMANFTELLEQVYYIGFLRIIQFDFRNITVRQGLALGAGILFGALLLGMFIGSI